jgi:acetolactate synthase-1/2/3 large subunit
MKGADAIARILKQEGVDFMGVIPMNTLEEAGAVHGVRPMIFRQERVGVNLADGYSRVTNGRGVGVFSMQAGPGAENAFAGVAQAYADSVPILLLPASAPRARAGVHPTFSPSQSYAGVTKWSDQINMIERIPEMMRRAFSQIRMGRPGPVLLEIPSDVLRGDFPDDLMSYSPVIPRASSGDPDDVRVAARMLLSAKRPIIQAGQGVLYGEAWAELAELAELTQVPVMTTMAGKSAFPEDHPLSLGTRSGTTTGPVVHFLERADLVFGIGCSFTRIHFGADQFDSKVIVHCTNSLDDVNKDYDPDHAVVGDAKLVLAQLIEEVKLQLGPASRVEPNGVATEIAAVSEDWMKDWLPLLTSDEVPINPYRVIWDLMNTIDRKNSIVTHDSGSPRDETIPFYETISPRGFIAWGKSTQLGYSLGLAMGARMAAPDKLAVHIIGDYGFGMVALDIETAVRERIPVLSVVLNNSAMGIYSPNSFPTANDLYGTKYTGGNFSQVAEAMGSYNARIEKPEEIVPAIKTATKVIEAGQPAVLEFITKEEQAFPFRGAV